MTLDDLIKKLNSETDTHTSSILQDWVIDLKSLEDAGGKEWVDNFYTVTSRGALIRGFLWGLYAAGFISNDERDALFADYLRLKQ